MGRVFSTGFTVIGLIWMMGFGGWVRIVPGLLGYEFLCVPARIRLLELYSLLCMPKFLVGILIEGYPSGFLGQRVG